MKFEISGGVVGTAEWRGPGDVAVEMEDPDQRAWFERYFASEDAFMAGPVECAEMFAERRDSSEEAFQRAAFGLAAYQYETRAYEPTGSTRAER